MTKIHPLSFNLGIVMAAITAQAQHGEYVIAGTILEETGADLKSMIGMELTTTELESLRTILDYTTSLQAYRVFFQVLEEGLVTIKAVDRIDQNPPSEPDALGRSDAAAPQKYQVIENKG